VSRIRIGGFAACGGLALLVLMPAPRPRSLDLAAPSRNAQLGITSAPAGVSLVGLDPVSLKRSGRALRLKGFPGVFAFAPDGRLLALAVRPHSEGGNETLRFFTVAGPAAVRRGVSLGGAAGALAWVRSDRILAYVDCCASAATILAIDPGARRVVARTPVDDSVLQIARGPDSPVLLVAETNRIGPSRLVVVDPDGASRSAKLDGILARTTWPADATSEPIGRRLIPGLAVDVAGNRAFVIGRTALWPR
jgi:hypothetical protein